MTNSSLIDMTILSPNHSGRRNQPIKKIAIHHTAGAISAATIGNIFKPTSRDRHLATMVLEMTTGLFYVLMRLIVLGVPHHHGVIIGQLPSKYPIQPMVVIGQ